jgi:hypothetical protein
MMTHPFIFLLLICFYKFRLSITTKKNSILEQKFIIENQLMFFKEFGIMEVLLLK